MGEPLFERGPQVSLARGRVKVDTGGIALCRIDQRGGQPIVDNVEDLRFWFGIVPDWSATDPAQRQPVRFVPPSDVGVDDWARVVSVRVCVLMRTAEPVLTGDEIASFRYRDCAGTDGNASPDRRIYRAFHSTVSLRNRSGY